MSTYILHDGVFYADRRKIINFPGNSMIKAEDSSKVKELSWCYLASAGFELSEVATRAILRFVTLFEATDAMVQHLKSFAEDHKLSKEVDKIASEVMAFRKMIDVAAKDIIGGFNFIVVTKKHRYSCTGSPEKHEDVFYSSNENSEVIGSCASAVRVLLLNGVNVPDIYRILRESKVPTGEKCDSFKVSDLSDEIPPISGPLVFAYAMAVVQDSHSKEQYKEALDSMVNIRYLAKCMFKKRYNKVVFNDIAVKEIVSTWESKKFRETKAFAAYMGK